MLHPIERSVAQCVHVANDDLALHPRGKSRQQRHLNEYILGALSRHARRFQIARMDVQIAGVFAQILQLKFPADLAQ